MPPPAANLLLSASRGSDAAARALWEAHAPRLLAYARSIVRDHSLADDVVQEALCRALRQDARTLRAVSDVAAWLTSLVRREALNQLRSLSRARRRALAHAERAVRSAPPEALLSTDVQRAIDRLPRRDREVLVLRHVCGLTFDQLAPATGLSRSAAASRYTAALARLRALLPHPSNDESLPAAPASRSGPTLLAHAGAHHA
jgi:RNA polymerase sigma-70 factor (ECF subfamily)